MSLAQLYQQVTQTIITQLEQGTAPWTRPWALKGGGVMPSNYATGRKYQGINVVILWDRQIRACYPSSRWLTYKQAQAIGAQVRAGEKATRVVYTNKLTVGEGEEAKSVGYLKAFFVFNQAQIDGLPAEAPPPELTEEQRDNQTLRFIANTKADIRHGGDLACYVPSKDFVLLPYPHDFESYEHYLATALHELIHFSGHETRLNRDLKNRFGTKAYAAEELVAELGAAFLCAHLGVEGKLRHAEYLANWLELLKEDDRAIFTAASQASKAADYLRAFSEQVEEAA